MGLRDQMKAETENKLVPIRKQMDEVRELQTVGPQKIEAAVKKLVDQIDNMAETIEPMAQAMVQIQDSAQETVKKSAEVQAKQAKAMTDSMKKVIGEFKTQADELAEAERSVVNSANRAEAAVRKMEQSGKAIRFKFLVLILIGGLLLGTAAGIGSWTLLKHQYINHNIETAWPGDQKTQDTVKGAFR